MSLKDMQLVSYLPISQYDFTFLLFIKPLFLPHLLIIHYVGNLNTSLLLHFSSVSSVLALQTTPRITSIWPRSSAALNINTIRKLICQVLKAP